jgi:hypothetical protein
MLFEVVYEATATYYNSMSVQLLYIKHDGTNILETVIQLEL